MRHAGHFREPVRGRKWTDILGKLLKVVATKSCKRVMESCPFRVLIGLTNPHSAACSPTVWHTACHLATHGTDALSGIAVLCHTSDQILTIWQRNLIKALMVVHQLIACAKGRAGGVSYYSTLFFCRDALTHQAGLCYLRGGGQSKSPGMLSFWCRLYWYHMTRLLTNFGVKWTPLVAWLGAEPLCLAYFVGLLETVNGNFF